MDALIAMMVILGLALSLSVLSFYAVRKLDARICALEEEIKILMEHEERLRSELITFIAYREKI